jgi:hypothetical protein
MEGNLESHLAEVGGVLYLIKNMEGNLESHLADVGGVQPHRRLHFPLQDSTRTGPYEHRSINSNGFENNLVLFRNDILKEPGPNYKMLKHSKNAAVGE